jgi:hypothetical protein
MLLYVLGFVNRDPFLGYRLEYVCVSINGYAKWLKQQNIWLLKLNYKMSTNIIKVYRLWLGVMVEFLTG